MNNAELILARTFSSSQPDKFARILEHHTPAETAHFLQQHAAELSASYVGRLLPRYLSQVGEYLDAQQIAHLLQATDTGFLAAVLRNLPTRKRNSVLGHLAAPRRVACQLLLDYPLDAVGSWMNSTVVALPADSSIASARQLVKQNDDSFGSGRVFVVDRDRILLGYTSLLKLSRAGKKDEFASLCTASCVALLSGMTIQTALQNDSWSQVDMLPVVNRDGLFVGAIRHVDLRMAQQQLGRKTGPTADENPLQSLIKAYGTTCLALFTSMEDLMKS